MGIPKITFGIIVLNGEPFTRYNLRALYPFAHQIIVAEGASPFAAHATMRDGHSKDGTLDILDRFRVEEDPEGKVTVITAEDEGYPDGFWLGEKDEQSRAYAKRATGDWLWQVDIDEFYQPEDVQRIVAYLRDHPETTCLTFQAYHFWGGFDYILNGGLVMSRFQGEPWGAYRRVFKWGTGYRYAIHRPPTIFDAKSKDITREKLRSVSKIWRTRPPMMYHYSWLFPFQLKFKGWYYESNTETYTPNNFQNTINDRLLEVNERNRFSIFFNIYSRHSWLERFKGEHPPEIQKMKSDIKRGKLKVNLRRTNDIENVLCSSDYEKKTKRLLYLEKGLAFCHLCYSTTRMFIVSHIRRFTPQWIVKLLPKPLEVKFRER